MLVLLVSLACCSSNRPAPRLQATSGHGKDFPEAALLALQLKTTTFGQVERAFGTFSIHYFDLHETYVRNGEKTYLQSLIFAYAPSDSCYPKKCAELYFRNGILEAYDYFNELGGRQNLPPDLSRLASFRSGVTTRQQVIAALGWPTAQATGHQTISTDLPGTVAYLWFDPIALHQFSMLTLNFNEKDEMVGPPVIDHSGFSTVWYPVQGLWICSGVPPLS